MLFPYRTLLIPDRTSIKFGHKVQNAYFRQRKKPNMASNSRKNIIILQKAPEIDVFGFFSQVFYKFVIKASHQYNYSRLYVYCFLKIFLPVRLFQTVRLFQSLAYLKGQNHAYVIFEWTRSCLDEDHFRPIIVIFGNIFCKKSTSGQTLFLKKLNRTPGFFRHKMVLL